ncbi:MAG: hypothetical protein BJ554DRAFT_6035 [Olpidium bornovanus]|uniref:Uncharacterized protein n=1 Tax=Olpidium bornovanus TaxID=278681 RepID=A0A8H8DKI6_9FUNG|nr:MAG: hypothetical protein BJ554DRAFT_6035 [Olpidium bornovanus]
MRRPGGAVSPAMKDTTGLGRSRERTTNLANQNNALSLRVVQEQPQAIHEVGAVERVAADAHTQALTQADLGRLVHGLVRERARPRHHADFALPVDVSRHDPNLALPGLDDARAVGTNQAGLVLIPDGTWASTASRIALAAPGGGT